MKTAPYPGDSWNASTMTFIQSFSNLKKKLKGIPLLAFIIPVTGPCFSALVLLSLSSLQEFPQTPSTLSSDLLRFLSNPGAIFNGLQLDEFLQTILR